MVQDAGKRSRRRRGRERTRTRPAKKTKKKRSKRRRTKTKTIVYNAARSMEDKEKGRMIYIDASKENGEKKEEDGARRREMKGRRGG